MTEAAEVVTHEHELRIVEDEFGNAIEDGSEQTVVKVRLPEGESLWRSTSFRQRTGPGAKPPGESDSWIAPGVASQLPNGLPGVELLVDGIVVARGKWPHLIPVA